MAELSSHDETIHRLENELLAPCCYRQSVADHRSAEAQRMRKEIVQLVGEGRTERQVLDYYKRKYGMRILSEPEGTIWWVATLVPAIFVALALFLLVRFLAIRSRHAAV